MFLEAFIIVEKKANTEDRQFKVHQRLIELENVSKIP